MCTPAGSPRGGTVSLWEDELEGAMGAPVLFPQLPAKDGHGTRFYRTQGWSDTRPGVSAREPLSTRTLI